MLFHLCVQLLGMDSNDIDICLTDMMGVTFAEGFVAFLSEHKDLRVHKIAKIESNPDQSKHLETARTTLLGIDLDFVNLRSEEYAENSRIPTEVVCSMFSLKNAQNLTRSHTEIWYTGRRCSAEGPHH